MRRLSRTGSAAATTASKGGPAAVRLRPAGGTVVRSVGRVLLWAVLGLVLVRGVGSILTDDPAERAPQGDATARRSRTWPDDEARAFVVRFATAYFGFSSKHPERDLRRVSAYFAQGLSDQAAAVLPSHGSGMSVALAAVAREVPLGDSRAQITVATTSPTGTVRYLTVPVARGHDGGLSVTALPSLAPPPAKGTTSADEPTPLAGPDAPAIRDLVVRFLSAYLAGKSGSTLSYFLAPGVRLTQMPAGLKVLSVGQVSRDPHPAAGSGGVAVVAGVRVKDMVSGAVYPLGYQLRVRRSDRWYVTEVAGGPSA